MEPVSISFALAFLNEMLPLMVASIRVMKSNRHNDACPSICVGQWKKNKGEEVHSHLNQ